jgi:hypothetical protein
LGVGKRGRSVAARRELKECGRPAHGDRIDVGGTPTLHEGAENLLHSKSLWRALMAGGMAMGLADIVA